MTADPRLVPRTAYVHIPFCAHHCGYCDFAVATGRDHEMALYIDALQFEARKFLPEPHPVAMRFLGGGTPTLLSPDLLRRLGDVLNERLPLVDDGTGVEFSTESTPDTLDADRVAALREIGVTRVSVGVQTFRPHLLPALDRRHNAASIRPAVERVQRAFGRASVDLIFGIPGQTLEDWDADLRDALALSVGHVSTYGLTYEKGTPLWKQRQRGQVAAVPEELELAMYEHAIDTLAAAGLEHYEVSNFARPGERCRHNEVYWANEAYHGLGMGAARYVDGSRELNTRGLSDYLRRALADESPTFQRERLEPLERAYETLAVQLRRLAGIRRREFEAQTGFPLEALAGQAIRALTAEGLLADDGASVRLTRRGVCVADGVVEALLA